MPKLIIEKVKTIFINLDKKILRILHTGLKLCLVIALISISILMTYLFFVHNIFLYEIGLAVFQLSLCFAAEFIASAITVDTISKQLG